MNVFWQFVHSKLYVVSLLGEHGSDCEQIWSYNSKKSLTTAVLNYRYTFRKGIESGQSESSGRVSVQSETIGRD